MKGLAKWSTCVFLTSALILLGFNLLGFILPLRNPIIKAGFMNVALEPDQFWNLVEQDYTSNKDFVRTVNNATARTVYQYWEPSGLDSFHERIPIYDNYILFGLSYVSPHWFMGYEIVNPHRAVERGIGICSQNELIVSSILEEHGIDAHVMQLAYEDPTMGMIVVAVNFEDGSQWVCCTAYGVTFPYSLEELQRDPTLAEPYYAEVSNVTWLYPVNMPAIEKIMAHPSVKEWGTYSDQLALRGEWNMEDASYLWKWIIPAGLLILSSLPYLWVKVGSGLWDRLWDGTRVRIWATAVQKRRLTTLGKIVISGWFVFFISGSVNFFSYPKIENLGQYIICLAGMLMLMLGAWMLYDWVNVN